MAQSYFPASASASAGSPQPLVESSPKHLNEGVQEAYLEHKNSPCSASRLLNALDNTKSILGDLRQFNKDDWVVRYPQLQEQPATAESSATTKRRGMRRSLSFPDDPSFQADVVVSPAKAGLTRSVTLASIADKEEDPAAEYEEDGDRLVSAAEVSDFNVFRLDLKLGPHGSSSSPAALVAQLEKSSIANLLDDRVVNAVNHLNKLRSRIEDTSSKVLVTGDLNAGKSTFVNALLGREIMPVDQQPCTTAFCEVHDARENDGKEEVHILKEGATYSAQDESTFTRASLSDLDAIVSENENDSQVLKIYLADPRDPQASLLSNGVVDISLIDAPGLNRDNTHTTRVFARQEEIDIVVFVVSAENHFTLSAKEFLTNASNEKAYLFIVVNKYEQIRDKAKCKRMVLEQIKQLSPRTYEDAEDLVHFVDSQHALHEGTSSFGKLESALRSFVLVKRAKSKLAPASTYLTKLLADVDLLVGTNAIVAQKELERARDDLNRVRPVLEKMKGSRETLEESLESIEEDGASHSRSRTKELLTDAVERIGQGKLGVDAPSVHLPSYPGLLGIWDYAREVRRTLLASLDAAVKLAEEEARIVTIEAVDKIAQLGDKHLPEGVERSKRVFMPEAMFSFRADKKGNRKSRQASRTVVAGGMYGLGIGLAQRPDMLETTFFDLFDVQHQFWIHFGEGKDQQTEEVTVSTLGYASVGLGALTMVGGKAIGARSLVEGIVRVCDIFENETARKWAAPVLGAVTIGLVTYFVLELPSTIPKTVGRRIKASLAKESEEKGEESSFIGANATRVSREVRKVLRLAGWDVRERFRAAMEEHGREVHGAEEMERTAMKALDRFCEIEKRTGEVRESVVLYITNPHVLLYDSELTMQSGIFVPHRALESAMDEHMSNVISQLQQLVASINDVHTQQIGRLASGSDAETLQKWRSFDTALLESSRQIRYHLNGEAPINSLPREILSEIFALASCDGFDTRNLASEDFSETSIMLPKNLRRITTVCRAWRDVALSAAFLWSHFVVDTDWDERAYTQQLRLSQNAPTKLYIQKDSRQRAAARLLKDLGSRLRELYIFDYSMEWEHILPVLPVTTSLLTQVSIEIAPRSRFEPRGPLENEFLSGVLGNLRRFNLSGAPFLPTGQFPNLTYLHAGGGGPHQLSSLLSFLSAAPKLEIILLSLRLEQDLPQCHHRTVHLPHLRRCALNMGDIHAEILPQIAFPPTCLVLFGTLTDALDEVLSAEDMDAHIRTIVGLLPTHPFAQHLTRLRIIPGNRGWDSVADTDNTYHVQLSDEQGASGVHFEVSRIFQSSDLRDPEDIDYFAEDLADVFWCPGGVFLAADVKELWLHKWTEFLSPTLLACFPSLETVGLVLSRKRRYDEPIPPALGRGYDGYIHCPTLTTVCLYTCDADAVDDMRDILQQRKRGGHRVRRLAIECKDAKAHRRALKLDKYVHELFVTMAKKDVKWWEDCTDPWEGQLREWPDWPEWFEWRRQDRAFANDLSEESDSENGW
ncbi:hypothetical protein BD309DRAFT_929950 [Dichomitus squalens]|uniref:Uncharacterized protein n=1 Tax=Dichomitus squalens TaxID=114155 RepID=A0A4Q9PSI2_9APHY|nr:hypothetical protein BD309DRAFT_929950 [Dichomitus squalens]TBU57324.1 hypothetical protein BD310DRAFT_880929 [Dichomitus squalens]